MCGISPVSGVSGRNPHWKSMHGDGHGHEQGHGHGHANGRAHGHGHDHGHGAIQGPSASNAPSGIPTGGGTTSKALIDEINRVRAMHGLNPLEERSNLDDAAVSNDAANVSTGETAHHNGLIDGSSGEITAMVSNGETPEKAVEQWLNSPGHRAILLDPDMKYVGASINGAYATADFS